MLIEAVAIARILFSFPLTLTKWQTILSILKNKHSTGHDGLSNMMVKFCAPVIMKLLVVCLNEMFIKETFPDICKIAKVIALFKSGSDIDFNNYRPISLLSPIINVFEKLIYRRKFFTEIQKSLSLTIWVQTKALM